MLENNTSDRPVTEVVLTLRVRYAFEEGTQAPDFQNCQEQLTELVRRASGEGLFTHLYPEMVVDGYTVDVSKPKKAWIGEWSHRHGNDLFLFVQEEMPTEDQLIAACNERDYFEPDKGEEVVAIGPFEI